MKLAEQYIIKLGMKFLKAYENLENIRKNARSLIPNYIRKDLINNVFIKEINE